MTQVFPISSVSNQSANTPPKPTNELGQDTFLKLLVAQMKYQDPMSPVDSTQFLTQSAQFTTLETLQKIEQSQESLAQSSQMLSAASMVGRAVTYSLTTASGGQSVAPTGTSIVSMRGSLPKDAEVGAHATAETTVFTSTGQSVPLKLQFTKTADGWNVQAQSNGRSLGSPLAMKFDASGDLTTGDLTIPKSALEGVAGTTDEWPATGVTLTFGDADDSTRLQLASGPATVAVAEQNGNDGNTATGIVTGIHMTANGPMLVIGGHEVPLTSISDVLA